MLSRLNDQKVVRHGLSGAKKRQQQGLTVNVSALAQDNIEELQSKTSVVQLNEIFSPTEKYIYERNLSQAKEELSLEVDRYVGEYRKTKDSIARLMKDFTDKVQEYREKRRTAENGGESSINFKSLLSI